MSISDEAGRSGRHGPESEGASREDSPTEGSGGRADGEAGCAAAETGTSGLAEPAKDSASMTGSTDAGRVSRGSTKSSDETRIASWTVRGERPRGGSGERMPEGPPCTH